ALRRRQRAYRRSFGWETSGGIACVTERGLKLAQVVDHKPTEDFGVEVGRLLRHESARGTDFANVFDGGGVHQEDDVRGFVLKLCVDFLDEAWVVQVRLIALCFEADAGELRQNEVMYDRDI